MQETVDDLKKKLADEKVVLGLSGGVDSTVAAVLLHKAIGKNLHCIFVDNGLLRKNEFNHVLEQYQGMGLNVKELMQNNVFIMCYREFLILKRNVKQLEQCLSMYLMMNHKT